MIFVEKFETISEAGKRHALRNSVYAHRMWSKVTFWEEVLLIGLCESHAAEAIWRRQLSPSHDLTNGQPPMTNFLTRLVKHMQSFGIRAEQAKQNVISNLRKHAPLVG